LALPPSDEFGWVQALHSALAAPLPQDELVLAQRRAKEQAPPVKPPRGALLPEKPQKQVAPQAGAEPPERARQAWLPQQVAAQARLRASVWPSGRTWRLRPQPLRRRVP
jgi:hypothetical protein